MIGKVGERESINLYLTHFITGIKIQLNGGGDYIAKSC